MTFTYLFRFSILESVFEEIACDVETNLHTKRTWTLNIPLQWKPNPERPRNFSPQKKFLNCCLLANLIRKSKTIPTWHMALQESLSEDFHCILYATNTWQNLHMQINKEINSNLHIWDMEKQELKENIVRVHLDLITILL